MKKGLLVGLFAAMLLNACGGGGSNSGGGNELDGVYSGVYNATLSTPGISPKTSAIRIIITVKGNNVSVSDGVDPSGGGASGKGTRNGKNFNVSWAYSGTEDGIYCKGSDSFVGAIEGSVASGSGKGTATCSRGGVSINIVSKGTFRADKSQSRAQTTTVSANEAVAHLIR